MTSGSGKRGRITRLPAGTREEDEEDEEEVDENDEDDDDE